VFPHAVIRGDENTIIIDEGSNIQDCCVIHTDAEHQVIIGKSVSVGHAAMIHGATIEDECLIGIHSTVLNGAHIGRGSMIGAGAVVLADMKIPENSLVLGVPGKIVKQDPTMVESIKKNAETYRKLSQKHKQGLYESFHPL
jgi:carbonic anhydrase/acetyltransferase-like protein (isoleucine patch superfamily)